MRIRPAHPLCPQPSCRASGDCVASGASRQCRVYVVPAGARDGDFEGKRYGPWLRVRWEELEALVEALDIVSVFDPTPAYPAFDSRVVDSLVEMRDRFRDELEARRG